MNECFVDNYDPFEWRRIAFILVKRIEDALSVNCDWGYDYTQHRIFINIIDYCGENSDEPICFGDCGILRIFYYEYYRNHPICRKLKLFISDIDGDDCKDDVIHFTLSYGSSQKYDAKIIEQYRISIFRNIKFDENENGIIHVPMKLKDVYQRSFLECLHACTTKSGRNRSLRRKKDKKAWYLAASILRFMAHLPLEMVLYIGQYVFSNPRVSYCNTIYIADGLSRFQHLEHNKRRRIEN